MPQQRQCQKDQREADVHIQLGRKPLDEKASQESCRIDAAADREWFAQNSRAMRRERPASLRELKADGMPPGTRAVIFRGPRGSQIRMFFPAIDIN